MGLTAVAPRSLALEKRKLLTQPEQALLVYLRLDGEDDAETVAQPPRLGNVTWDQMAFLTHSSAR